MKLASLAVLVAAGLWCAASPAPAPAQTPAAPAPAARAKAPTQSYEPAEPAPGRQVVQRGAGYDYLIYLPPDYEQQKSVPLVISLHGIGAKDLDAAIVEMPAARVVEGHQFPFVLVSPFWHFNWWSPDEMMVLINSIATKYKIDPQRIYLTGFSMGGISTWDIATKHPEFFAAILPLAGDTRPNLAPNLKDVPVWAFHGAKDDTVRMQEEQKMVDALKAAGSEVKYTVLPNKGHVVRRDAYDDQAVWDWLLSHRKAKPAPIDAMAELRYDVRHRVVLRAQPLVIDSSTVGKVATSLDLQNPLKVPVQMRGTLSAAAGMHVQPDKFDVSLAPGASQSIAYELTGEKTEVATAAPVEAKWTATARQAGSPDVTADFSRRLPISRLQTCPRLPKPVVIDGDLSDWPLPLAAVPLSGDRGGKPAPVQASLAIASDDQAVYVAVRITDAHVYSDPKKPVWEQDGVEVRLDFRANPRGPEFQDWKNILPVLVSPTQTAASPTLWQSADLPKGTHIASKITPTGYDTEIAIPLSYANGVQGGALRQFRMNLCINETDGKSRVAKYWWHPSWQYASSDDGIGTFQCVAP